MSATTHAPVEELESDDGLRAARARSPARARTLTHGQRAP